MRCGGEPQVSGKSVDSVHTQQHWSRQQAAVRCDAMSPCAAGSGEGCGRLRWRPKQKRRHWTRRRVGRANINSRCCSLTRRCIGRTADSGARCRVFQKCDDARTSGRNEALRSATMRSERQQAPGELTAAQTASVTTQHASVVAVAQPAAINAAAAEVLSQGQHVALLCGTSYRAAQRFRCLQVDENRRSPLNRISVACGR